MINPEKIPTRESVKSSESVVELEVNLEEAAEKGGGWLEWIAKKLIEGPLGRLISKLALPFIFLFPGFSVPARAEDFSKILGKTGEKIVALVTLREAVDKIVNKNKEEKKLADEASKKTKELNNLPEILKFLEKGERFAIDPNIRIIPYGYFPGSNLDLPNLTKHLIGALFSKLGLKQVGTLEDIKKTARERQELRAIPEVKQEQVPKPGTLEVPQFEISTSVSILFNVKEIRKDIEVALRNIGFDLRKHLEKLGFKQAEFLSIFDSLREIKVIAIVVIDILNLETNEKITIIGIGTPYMLEKISADIKRVLFVGGVEKSSIKKDDMAVVNSIASGVGNILLGLEEEKQKEGEKGKTQGQKRAAVFFVISIPEAEV